MEREEGVVHTLDRRLRRDGREHRVVTEDGKGRHRRDDICPRLDTLPGVNRRPKLSIVAPNVSPDEAAAVVAAVERFMRETAPPRVAPAPPRNPWLTAGLYERVARWAGLGANPP